MRIVSPAITMWLALVASLLTLVVNPTPTHAGGDNQCVDPVTIGGNPHFWQEQSIGQLLPNRYFRYERADAYMAAPQSGQLTPRIGPDTKPMTPGQVIYGHSMAYWCGPDYPAPPKPFPLFLPHTGGGQTRAPAQIPHR